jgi:4-hydroxybenzoate polyprenyltransferase
MHVSGWLRRIGQQWRLNLGVAWILGSILLLIIVIVAAPFLEWILAAVAFSAAGFGWTALAVRCPACRKRAVFWTMLHEPGHGWLLRISQSDCCPVCEDFGRRPS